MESIDQIKEKAKTFAMNKIAQFSDQMVYHDLKFANRLQKYILKISEDINFNKEDSSLAEIGGWIWAASQDNIKITSVDPVIGNFSKAASKMAKEFLKTVSMEPAHQEKLLNSFKGIGLSQKPETEIGKLIADAEIGELIMEKGKKHLDKFYKELILKDVNLTKQSWYDITLALVINMEFNLPYCKDHFQPVLDDLALDLQKAKKNLAKSADLALKRELSISDQELKALKSNLQTTKNRDVRAIQTVFRTTSKNHYTLNEMVDKKANIMITVNSIILSLVLGGVIGEQAELMSQSHNSMLDLMPVMILTLTALGSIIFAILSIRPGTTHGKFTEEEIRNKGGNLLYFGNFHQMEDRDFEWAFLQMMNDQNYLYSSMIKDIYYLGILLEKKYKLLRLSLTIFLVGFSLAVILFILLSVFTLTGQ